MAGNDAVLVASLLEQPTIAKAAKAAGISERTAFRRLESEEFRKLYDEERSKIITAATGRLQAATGLAVDSLIEVLESDLSLPTAKISASRAILEYGLKYGELVDVIRRIERLEALANDDQKETGCA